MRLPASRSRKERLLDEARTRRSDRSQPVVARGPIELQTHGSEIRFRNIFIREIPEAEAKKTLAAFSK